MGLIDYNFYYRHNNGGGGWMPKLADYYGGRNNANALLGLRRSIVPSTMLDWKGDLYTVSLNQFTDMGPQFAMSRLHCSNGVIELTQKVYHSFWEGFDDKNPTVGNEPYFSGNTYDDRFFKNCFHNVLNPCILQEVETPTVIGSTNLRIFHYIPTVRLIGSHWTSRTDFEGGLWFMVLKSDFYNRINIGRDNRGWLAWYATIINYGRSSSASFAHQPGNYQGFQLESNPFREWIFYPYCVNWQIAGSDSINLSDENCYMACSRYNGADHSKMGDVTFSASNGLNSNVAILPRFFKIGNYVYFATIANGYFFWLYRIIPSQSADNNVGTIEKVGSFLTDCYVETTSRGHSNAPYNWDFCILELDGTPSTASSMGADKILCVFGLGGGGNYTGMTESYNWSSTYVNWTYNNAGGVIGSFYFNSTDTVNNNRVCVYAQNTIYVTDHARAAGEYVGLADISKSDEYRLYLNTHKMVPYTSPSGKHYLIYAYCYPGKKQHLYLGYAQYIIDSNHQLRLLTKCEFKGSGNNGWGDSFGRFTDCSRIISMDLKAGHLWITWVKDTGIDATSLSEANRMAAGHFDYFHILVSDLIPE